MSRSGVGISLGVRGASISTGPRGTYVNMGIPGTGIAHRQKLNSNPISKISYDAYNLIERDYLPGSTFQFQIDDDGKETFVLIDPNGKPFTNDAFIRRIKRTPEYKEMVEKSRKAKNDFLKKQNEDVIFIYKSTPKLVKLEDVEKERDDTSGITQNVYQLREFNEIKPEAGDRYGEAWRFAFETVKTHKFWKKKRLINEAADKKMKELYELDMKEWEKRRDEFLVKEKKVKGRKGCRL